MNILGISAFYHDSAACILVEGEIMAAAQEERFSRKKHDHSFPTQSVIYCLEESGLSLSDIDAVCFYDKPFLKFERLLETYYNFAPKGLKSFLTAIPVWLEEKLFLKREIRKQLGEIEDEFRGKPTILFPEHHLSHSASAFYCSPFTESAILTLDGVGEWATATISQGKGKDITIMKEMVFPHSVGLLYSAFTYFLGFRVNSGEYKLMGLAPFGNPFSSECRKFIELIQTQLVEVRDDGSIHLNLDNFSFCSTLKMVPEKKWEQIFGFSRRSSESEITQSHANLAYAIQHVTESIVLKMCTHAKEITGSSNLCLSGGVALNCVANGKISRSELFQGIFIQPASGDAGGAIGAALAGHHIHFQKEREVIPTNFNPFLGPEYSELQIRKMKNKYSAVGERFPDEELVEKIAELLKKGKVVGWFQDRMEFGPRALGNRSILGNPFMADTQKSLNLKIKFRESFRPFAPVFLEEDLNYWFEDAKVSPYMLLVSKIKKEHRLPLPDNYTELSINEKLAQIKSKIPAVTHVDFSSRLQSVNKEFNPKLFKLLTEFKKITGIGMLVNTSFNVRSEPIVCSPEDAFKCFMRTKMDYLVIGSHLFIKEQQPPFEEGDSWKENFKLD